MKRSIILLLCGFFGVACAIGSPKVFRRIDAHGLSIDVPAKWIFALCVCAGDVSYEDRGLLRSTKANIELRSEDWSDTHADITGSEWVAWQLKIAREVDSRATQETLSDLGSWHRTKIGYAYRSERSAAQRCSIIFHWSDSLRHGLVLTVATQESRWKNYADIFEHVVQSETESPELNQASEPAAASGRRSR
jgi:hypothetical protein